MTKTKSIGSSLKLNYKRTFLIGFAFFGILLLWQVYDSWCPTLLTEILGNSKLINLIFGEATTAASRELQTQWLVGIIMACDNLAALILLPIFGSISDKTKTPIGKRMPFILIGTFVSAVAFPFIPFFFHTNNVVGMICIMGVVLLFMMMYRNPAVALMPDITPKPLRAKANGIINIMGYFGGAFASVIGIFLKITDYLQTRNIWVIELPFLLGSVLMVISAFVLFFKVKENKLAVELKDEMEEGERQAAIATPVDDNKPMSKENKIMLLGILIAEFLWFMADNAIGTFIGNFNIYFLNTQSSSTMILTIIGGVASVAGFAIAGKIADKIGRKWTISAGLGLTLIGYIVMFAFVRPSGNLDAAGFYKLPISIYIVWIIKGFGMSLVHNCSFPMVVELCSSKKIGKFTGYYYASSMAAQTITPILLGLLFTVSGIWGVLPIYALVLIVASFLVFTLIVKNIKANKVKNAKGLEAIGGDD